MLRKIAFDDPTWVNWSKWTLKPKPMMIGTGCCRKKKKQMKNQKISFRNSKIKTHTEGELLKVI